MSGERKQKAFQVKGVNDGGEVLAVIATLNVVDHGGDITLPGAFGKQEVPIVPAHDWKSVPLGRASIYEEGDKVVARMKFNLDSTAGKEWYGALKFDFDTGTPLQEYSYGYQVMQGESGQKDGEYVYYLKSVKAHEVSPVLLGMGIGTRTLDVKKSGLTMDNEFESAESALVSVAAFVDRVKALATLRAGEGRGIAAKHLDRLGRLEELARSIDFEIKSAAANPDIDAEELQRIYSGAAIAASLRVR